MLLPKQETVSNDSLFCSVSGWRSLLLLLFFQCLRVGGGISAWAWADVSRVAWQVYVATGSLSLIKSCCAKWIYSRVVSCCSCVILSHFKSKMTHIWRCPWDPSFCRWSPTFFLIIIEFDRVCTTTHSSNRKGSLCTRLSYGWMFLYVPVAFSGLAQICLSFPGHCHSNELNLH